MTTSSSYVCSSCSRQHDGPPFSYGTLAPAYWHPGLENRPGNVLGEEQCVIEGTHFFVRGRLVLPIIDAEQEFDWGVWVSVSQANFDRMAEVWDSPSRIEEPPYFGWLASELPLYKPTTLELKTNLHTQPVGTRPTVELEPTDHPLAIQQRTGITLAHVQTIAEQLLHSDRPAD
ncbi:DUF2199 domain-containing protein [Nocardia arthritidis]|uniref:DUF2199 domain-containing protein n=1 Tax=Nocardia arthritidis TaxID=228602 RepID=UPI00142D68E3|nr:DUF2199 domain-containing protein [Nocardia arthritidis]